MRRCYGCMKEYDEKFELCPFCGFVADTMPKIKCHLLPGTRLADRYVVGRAIGHGGFGITYIAWDEQLSQPVAIKEYFPTAFAARSFGDTGVCCINEKVEDLYYEGVKKAVDEAERISKFSGNKNIVDIHDFFEENNTAYIVMEFLEGEDLKALLKECGGTLTPEQAVALVLPVLNALSDMHSAHIIHRDISPDNIFICCDGQVKLLDFGSARLAMEDDEKSMSVMVKHGYTPVEQYTRHSYQGSWTDVYAVCATLYKVITGVLPSQCSERNENPLKSFESFGINGYTALQTVIFAGLEPDYQNRIKSAEVLSRGLKQALEKKDTVPSVVATETSTVLPKLQKEKTPGVINRKLVMGITVGVAIAAILIAAIVAGVTKSGRNEPEEATSANEKITLYRPETQSDEQEYKAESYIY